MVHKVHLAQRVVEVLLDRWVLGVRQVLVALLVVLDLLVHWDLEVQQVHLAQLVAKDQRVHLVVVDHPDLEERPEA